MTLKTLYIDVYFLINFTIDILAIFIAAKLSSIRARMLRVIVSSAFGAFLAIVNLFAEKNFLRFVFAAIFVLLMSLYVCAGVSIKRRAKFIALFYFSSFVISGAVTYVYEILDKYLIGFFEEAEVMENRSALIVSLVILLAIGVLRILIMVFNNSINEKSARIYFKVADKTLELDALVDSGNLVKDPMNMNPVLFLKKIAASSIFPTEVIELSDIDNLENSYRKRIRLIPVTRNGETHVMTGVRVDEVAIYNNDGKREAINATIVIDKEGGTFGGFEALVPYAAVKNVF